ncbi:hybrid sensor histidine kinase/response regulator [bacterium]|nr:hybrid sensor histidine kinase/response regulator [bacterium]
MTDTNQKPSVLIVDDNPKNLQVLGSLLTQNGYSAVAAQGGEQALEYIKKKEPEIILLDIMMPGMDGIEVCKRLKDDEDTREIPILFITALTEVNDKIKAFAAGGADYLTKPFVKEEVLARIEVHLKNARYLKQLTETNQHLKDLNKLKDDFLGMATHDIRSPLSGVNGVIDLILTGELGEINDQQREFLELILKSGKQIMNLVNDLLDISVIESGNLKLTFENCRIRSIIEDRIRLHQFTVKKKEIMIISDLKDNPELTLDPERFGQVLDNLLSNAAKFSPEKSKIFVSLEADKTDVIIKIRDEGPGISKEDQEKLFGMYRKLSARPTSGEKSSGLGLAIARKIIDGHQGDIYVESSLGKGATFVIVLPLK